MSFKIALCQHETRNSKEENLKAASDSVKKAAAMGAKIVVLPEMFVCQFVPSVMRENVESLDGLIVETLRKMALENKIWLIGGSFPESAGSVMYNTCPVFAPDGKMAGIYRKTHLFDVDIKGSVTATESDVFTPGNRTVTIDTGFVRLGIAICYDLRFPYVFTELAKQGAQIACVPAAFSAKTGEAHWEILLRARALDSQMYIAGTCGAYGEDAAFKTYGHSMVADPWGRIISKTGADEGIITADIETEQVEQVRRDLPVLKALRQDLI